MSDPNVDGYLAWEKAAVAALKGKRLLCTVPAAYTCLAFERRAILQIGGDYAYCMADGACWMWTRDNGYEQFDVAAPTGFDEVIPKDVRDLWLGKDEQQKQ
ncbi:MAG: hypothetical protein WC998_09670 [Candidatus Paceibacterota bacterium]|jgi:hypothetical protein